MGKKRGIWLDKLIYSKRHILGMEVQKNLFHDYEVPKVHLV